MHSRDFAVDFTPRIRLVRKVGIFAYLGNRVLSSPHSFPSPVQIDNDASRFDDKYISISLAGMGGLLWEAGR